MASVVEAAPVHPGRRRWALLVVFTLVVLALDLFTVLINDEWSLLGALFGNESIVVRLLLITVSGLVLYRWRGVHDTHSVVLFLLLIPTIYQFRGLERRMVADGFYYYSYVQSFWKDFDLRFENDYRKLGILHRPSLDQVTATGHRRNIFSVGPAIFWTPFFLLGEVSGRVAAWSGVDVNLQGNGPFHWNAVAIGSLFYGFLAVLFIQSLLRRYFSRSVAFAGALLTWLATQLHWYMVYQPWMAHALGTFTVALFIWYWDRSRLRRGYKDAFLLGLIGGLLVCVRWQNGLILFLPFLDWLYCLWRRDREVLVVGPVLLAGFFIGLAPQLVAWQVIYGHLYYFHPPHGSNYVRYSQTFSGRAPLLLPPRFAHVDADTLAWIPGSDTLTQEAADDGLDDDLLPRPHHVPQHERSGVVVGELVLEPPVRWRASDTRFRNRGVVRYSQPLRLPQAGGSRFRASRFFSNLDDALHGAIPPAPHSHR